MKKWLQFGLIVLVVVGLVAVNLFVSRGPVSAQPPGPCGVSILGNYKYWSFDGNLDSSQSPPDPGLLDQGSGSVTFATGHYNQAVDLEQDNAHHLVEIGENVISPPITDLTVAGWIWMEDFNDPFDTTIFISQYEFGVNNRSWRFGIKDNGRLRFVTTPDGTYDFATHAMDGGTVLSLNTWYHVAAVFDGTAQEMRVYLNGQLDGTKAVSWSTLYNSTADLTFGGNYENGVDVQHYDGLLDEWLVIQGTLTESEIDDLYTCDLSTPTPTPTDTPTPTATLEPTPGITPTIFPTPYKTYLCAVYATGYLPTNAGNPQTVAWNLPTRPHQVDVEICADAAGTTCTDDSIGYSLGTGDVPVDDLGVMIAGFDASSITFYTGDWVAWLPNNGGWIDRANGFVNFIAYDHCEGGGGGPITGTMTGAATFTQAIANAYTYTLDTGNDFHLIRRATYGDVLAGAGGVVLLLVVGFIGVTKFSTGRRQ